MKRIQSSSLGLDVGLLGLAVAALLLGGCGDSSSGYTTGTETSNGTASLTSNGTSDTSGTGSSTSGGGETSTTGTTTTGPTSNATTGTGGGGTTNGETTVMGAIDGEPCTADADCQGGRCLLEVSGYPGGHCTTWDCAQTGLCTDDTAQCAFLDGSQTTSACFRLCTGDDTCRDGYTCRAFGNLSLCLPEQEEVMELNPDGAACTSGDECLGGTCILDSDGFPEGYCTTVNCRDRNDCSGDNTACLQARNPNYCIQLCETGSDCRDGYICQPVSGGAYCTPSPTAGTNIPDEGELPPEFDLLCGDSFVQADAFQGGFDAHAFSFTVPEGTTSMMVIPYSVGGDQLYPVEITGPGGTLEMFGNYGFASANTSFLINLAPVLVPQAPQFDGFIEAGEHTMEAAATSELCHYVLYKSGEGNTLDLNLYFVGVNGIDAESARTNPNFQGALETITRLYGNIDVQLGQVRYQDVEGQDAARYRIVRSEEAAFQLVATSQPPGPSADEHLSVNVFFIQDFAIPGGSVLGISAGLPGAAGLHGTRGSGLVFSAAVAGDPELLGQVLAHEIGHYLGLFHTSEQGGRSFDPLEDTDQCSPNVWGNPGNCPDINNLMFPFAGNDNTQISDNQAFVIRANPLVK